jgi:hypothetical protein
MLYMYDVVSYAKKYILGSRGTVNSSCNHRVKVGNTASAAKLGRFSSDSDPAKWRGILRVCISATQVDRTLSVISNLPIVNENNEAPCVIKIKVLQRKAHH